jgi:catechol 2,3-dioxygenase-like lactoylglutathione lyase family enzyme
MDVGIFSLSLTVQDIKVSRQFYEQLGFTVLDGNEAEGWLILENGATKLGLFQGMFEKNTLTFHPSDVRTIQKKLKEAGIKLESEAAENETGPTSIFLFDPDGNPILFDQF